MKPVALSLLASGLLATASSLPYNYMGHPVDPKYLPADMQKRQMSGLMGGFLNAAGAGKTSDPAGAAPKVQNLEPRVAGAKTVKLRYGPYKVPNSSVVNAASGHGGTLWNYPDPNVQKPCDDCTILGMNAGLEYPDGKNANIDTGMWLHHYVHFTVGPNRVDATCAGQFSLPHMLIGSSPQGSERFFSSGNERTHISQSILSGNRTDLKVGYHLRSNDKFSLIVDLMNENAEDKVVYLTVTYDFLDGNPEGYDDMRPVWFDAAQCATSEVAPPQQTGKFTITARAWKPNFEGEVLGYAGHLHNGGVSVDILVNGQNACTSKAAYGETPEYRSAAGSHSHDGDSSGMAGMQMDEDMTYISSMSVCSTEKLATGKKLSPNDSWILKGNYDYDTYQGMKNSAGRQDTIMGIAIMYAKVPRGKGLVS